MTRLEDNSVLYCTYGTLRKGYGNYAGILENREGVEYLGTMKTDPNYTMVSLGGFPAVKEHGNTSITVDVFKVTDENVIRRVNGLEGYSGKRGDSRNWYDTCEVNTQWGVANMFTMNNTTGRSIVETGDWNDFTGRNK